MSNLTKEAIKEYLKQAFDLEMAIYTHKRLIEEYKQKQLEKRPIQPELNLPSPPPEPDKNSSATKTDENATLKINSLYILGILGSLFGAMGFFACIDNFLLGGQIANNDDARGLMIFLALLLPLGIFLFIKARAFQKREYQRINDTKKQAMNKYEIELSEYNQNIQRIQKQYDDEVEIYNIKKQEYDRINSEKLLELNTMLTSLTSALEFLYSKNIVYAKYRDLVAISSIYEYFESGRCSELEGPNGAYNLYEHELRSNIIIASLSQIIDDLGQIKSRQYALFDAINQSNQTICYLLNKINDNQAMTAYYAEMAAKAASADRITYGVVF